MSVKRTARLRRAKRTRKHVKRLAVPRLSVHKTNQHTYAQVIAADGASVLAQASTMDKELAAEVKHGANIAAATAVGKLVAKRASDAGVGKAAFDRSGNRYHGRVKALADAAREGGLIE